MLLGKLFVKFLYLLVFTSVIEMYTCTKFFKYSPWVSCQVQKRYTLHCVCNFINKKIKVQNVFTNCIREHQIMSKRNTHNRDFARLQGDYKILQGDYKIFKFSAQRVHLAIVHVVSASNDYHMVVNGPLTFYASSIIFSMVPLVLQCF